MIISDIQTLFLLRQRMLLSKCIVESKPVVKSKIPTSKTISTIRGYLVFDEFDQLRYTSPDKQGYSQACYLVEVRETPWTHSIMITPQNLFPMDPAALYFEIMLYCYHLPDVEGAELTDTKIIAPPYPMTIPQVLLVLLTGGEFTTNKPEWVVMSQKTEGAEKTSLEKYATEGERNVISRFLDLVLAKGWYVSMDDGEEVTVRRSQDKSAIMAAMATTEEDYLRVYSNPEDKKTADDRIGWFRIIYGNAEDGSELIADYSANDLCEDIWKELYPSEG
jgi:hypothetical protein